LNKIIEVAGDLLKADTEYIAHQCNCITTYGKGLSASLFKRFPWADTYSNRRTPSVPGTIDVFGNGQAQRYVINMYSQYNPGKPKRPDDTSEQRQKWFYDCLTQISAISGIEEVAFPYFIGCGLAGGNRNDYYRLRRHGQKQPT
jgi:O-acetyl-ADP-ribose deacetylase (regulator of RNase III)